MFFFLYVEEAHKLKKKNKKTHPPFLFLLDKIPPEMSKPFFSLFLWSQDSRISAYLLVEDVSLEASLMGGGGSGGRHWPSGRPLAAGASLNFCCGAQHAERCVSHIYSHGS